MEQSHSLGALCQLYRDARNPFRRAEVAKITRPRDLKGCIFASYCLCCIQPYRGDKEGDVLDGDILTGRGRSHVQSPLGVESQTAGQEESNELTCHFSPPSDTHLLPAISCTILTGAERGDSKSASVVTVAALRERAKRTKFTRFYVDPTVRQRKIEKKEKRKVPIPVGSP